MLLNVLFFLSHTYIIQSKCDSDIPRGRLHWPDHEGRPLDSVTPTIDSHKVFSGPGPLKGSVMNDKGENHGSNSNAGAQGIMG